MKKFFLSIAISMFLLICLTGCGKPSTEDDVVQYLSTQYPTETFTIISKLETNASKTGGNVSGWEYKVKSNETNIEFLVSDSYAEVSGGWKSYELVDDYKTKAMEKYVNDFGDNRIALDTHMLKSDIRVEINQFSSINELSKVLYSFKVFYEGKKPFLEGASRYDAYVEVYIYESDIYKGFLFLSNKKESDIYESIKNII